MNVRIASEVELSLLLCRSRSDAVCLFVCLFVFVLQSLHNERKGWLTVNEIDSYEKELGVMFHASCAVPVSFLTVRKKRSGDDG